jgi:hypothetical protein
MRIVPASRCGKEEWVWEAVKIAGACKKDVISTEQTEGPVERKRVSFLNLSKQTEL